MMLDVDTEAIRDCQSIGFSLQETAYSGGTEGKTFCDSECPSNLGI